MKYLNHGDTIEEETQIDYRTYRKRHIIKLKNLIELISRTLGGRTYKSLKSLEHWNPPIDPEKSSYSEITVKSILFNITINFWKISIEIRDI